MKTYGLSLSALEAIRRIFSAHPAITHAVLYGELDNTELREHINRVGRVIFERGFSTEYLEKGKP